MNLKKAASAAIAAVMALSMSSSPAFAATAGPNILPVDGKKTQLRATVNSTYTLTVPEAIILNKVSQAKTGSGLYANTEDCVVSLKGDIGKDQTLTVTTSTPVLKCAGSPDETATIDTSAKSVFTRDDLFAGAVRGDDGQYSEPTGTSIVYPVSAKLTPGNWKGTVVFECALGDVELSPVELGGIVPMGAIFSRDGVDTIGDGVARFPETIQDGDLYAEGDYLYMIIGDPDSNELVAGAICIPSLKRDVSEGDFLIEGKIRDIILNSMETPTYAPARGSVFGMEMYAVSYSGLTELTEAPAIPDSVISMMGTFSHCTSLVAAPAIPDSVTNVAYTFSGCVNITEAPAIPNRVTNMHSTFQNCTSLANAPAIPANVTDMDMAFYCCNSLTGTLICDANPTSYDRALYDTKITAIEGSCTEETKAALLATK